MNDQEEAKDLINELPDAVLHFILSKIPTKHVITSSSVSKRWAEICAQHLEYATTLDFGEEFAKNQTPNQFADNINKILNLIKSEKIFKFKLLFSPRNEKHKSNAIDWIKFVTSKGVEQIELDFCRHIHIHFLSRAHIVGKKEAFELPDFLFDCSTLVNVRLSRCILALPQNYTGFRGVHTLCLKEVHITDCMLHSLLCSCTLLEVLALKECASLSSIRIVSSARLKRLTVYECFNASVIEISGPMIRSLLISAGHLDVCKMEDMLMLEEVFIGTRGDEFGGVLYLFMKVLPDLAHVTALTLYLGHLVPSLIKDLQVKFNNLLELQLVNSPLFGLFNSDVYCFFRHCACPSLQKIYIELSTVSEEENFVWEYRKPNVVPVNYVFNNLKTVTLRNFRGTISDIELAAYFLQRSPVLESIILIAPQSLNAKKSAGPGKEQVSGSTSSKPNQTNRGMQMDVHGMLRYRPKASPTVEITIFEFDEGGDHLLSFYKWHYVSDVYCK
ncbi:FBD-associated F-box protein At5g22730-like [Amaranthus tricolor]|uniref:FBD-associated F-box protein At5g22730-like n=1 Tax=Amaranthus tricolor TaxID=29722 RepID=UPI0025893776|nr:FBD-associated F-box protein At5g22730-like [Amaranthus tricolor]